MGNQTKFIDRIPADAKEYIEKKKLAVIKNPHQKKGNYTKNQFLLFYDGFDFMQYQIVVRPFILKKYSIDNKILEILLFLFPMNYFTRRDYIQLVRPFSHINVDAFVEKGFGRVAVNAKGKDKKVYTLTIMAKNIVTSYYEYLSGKKKLPMDEQINPMARAGANRSDKIRMELIRVLQDAPVSNTRQVFFQESNPDDKH